jgi:ParB-like chromosome segregation protein Spo0J
MKVSEIRIGKRTRRLAAVRLLGWRDVPVRVVCNLSDATSALRAERDENTERQAFRPSEQVSIARVLEPLERTEAEVRLRHAADAEARAGSRFKMAAARIVGSG